MDAKNRERPILFGSSIIHFVVLKLISLFDWLVREEVLLAGLCERKILFRLEIYDRLRQATAKRTG